MSALVCMNCGGPVRTVRDRADTHSMFECDRCGAPVSAKGPEIPRRRTSMDSDPAWTDVTPPLTPKDQATLDMFRDDEPEPKGPADTEPTRSEGNEVDRDSRSAQDDSLGREESRR